MSKCAQAKLMTNRSVVTDGLLSVARDGTTSDYERVVFVVTTPGRVTTAYEGVKLAVGVWSSGVLLFDETKDWLISANLYLSSTVVNSIDIEVNVPKTKHSNPVLEP